MKNKCIYGLLVGAMMAGACPVWGETVVGETVSPSDSIKLVVVSDNDALYYKVVKGVTSIVEKSALGITTSVGDFSTGLSEPSFTERLVDDSYSLPSGKRSRYDNTYKEATVSCNKDGHTVQFIFRVYDDGVAYRYAILGSGDISVYAENSECLPVRQEKVYSQQYTKNNQALYEENDTEFMACELYTPLPLLVHTGSDYLLLTEAMVNGNYCGSSIERCSSLIQITSSIFYGNSKIKITFLCINLVYQAVKQKIKCPHIPPSISRSNILDMSYFTRDIHHTSSYRFIFIEYPIKFYFFREQTIKAYNLL